MTNSVTNVQTTGDICILTQDIAGSAINAKISVTIMDVCLDMRDRYIASYRYIIIDFLCSIILFCCVSLQICICCKLPTEDFHPATRYNCDRTHRQYKEKHDKLCDKCANDWKHPRPGHKCSNECKNYCVFHGPDIGFESAA